MHAVAEVVIPPTDDIKKSVDFMMEYFREEDAGGNKIGQCNWWDWYVIGGRWSGHKLTCTLNKDQLERFYKKLKDEKVTVSSVRAGKESLEPSNQAALVDRLWREYFPGKGEVCPLRDPYSTTPSNQDVCLVQDIPKELTCTRLIVASQYVFNEYERAEPDEMLITEFWNGCTHQNTDYNGNVLEGLDRLMYKWVDDKKVSDVSQISNWYCVTVDYHN